MPWLNSLFTAAFASLLWVNALRGAENIVYSTFLGGTKDDAAHAVAIDSSGNAFVTGGTSSGNFPLLNPLRAEILGEQDAFLTKFSLDGTMLFSTYFGGSGMDFPEFIALDTQGNVWVIGFTQSSDLPVTPDAFQPDYAGGTAFGSGDGFIAKFSGDGKSLLYCSYIGGSGDDTLTSIIITNDGILLAGTTDSGDFPGAAINGTRGRQDVLIAKLDPLEQQLVWSRIIAGTGREWETRLALASDRAIYFTGSTISTNLPVTADAQQKSHHLPGENYWNGFFGILEPDGSAVRYLSYFQHPAEFSTLFDLALSTNGVLFLTGHIRSSAQGSSDAFQPDYGGGYGDAFIARLEPPEWQIAWFSYLGGSDHDWAADLALDDQENIYVTGSTASPDFPLKDALGKRLSGPWDAFLAKFSPDGKILGYSTFLGGVGDETSYRIALGGDQLPVVVGYTDSRDFPVQNAFQSISQSNFSTPREAFITKIHPTAIRPPLEIARSGASVIASWPIDAEDFVLESSASVLNSNWQIVDSTPIVLGSRNAVILKASDHTRFFRLARTGLGAGI